MAATSRPSPNAGFVPSPGPGGKAHPLPALIQTGPRPSPLVGMCCYGNCRHFALPEILLGSWRGKWGLVLSLCVLVCVCVGGVCTVGQFAARICGSPSGVCAIVFKGGEAWRRRCRRVPVCILWGRRAHRPRRRPAGSQDAWVLHWTDCSLVGWGGQDGGSELWLSPPHYRPGVFKLQPGGQIRPTPRLYPACSNFKCLNIFTPDISFPSFRCKRHISPLF